MAENLSEVRSDFPTDYLDAVASIVHQIGPRTFQLYQIDDKLRWRAHRYLKQLGIKVIGTRTIT